MTAVTKKNRTEIRRSWPCMFQCKHCSECGFILLFKLLAGIIAHSGAMISDAIHSASDVISTVVVMIGVHLSGKQSDKGASVRP